MEASAAASSARITTFVEVEKYGWVSEWLPTGWPAAAIARTESG